MLLASPSARAAAEDLACRKDALALAAEASQNPLLKLQARVSDDLPAKIKTRAREITERLSECFHSKKLTRAQRRQAQMNLALNLIVPTSSIIWSHNVSVQEAQAAGKKAPDFPFDLLGSVVVLYAWQSVIQCENEMLPNEAPNASFAQRSFDKYKKYFGMDLGGTAVYMAAILTEDLIRGHEVGTGDQLKELGSEGAVGFAWDTGMSVAHVLILDKVLMRYMPGGRAWITSMVKKGLFRGRFAEVGGKKMLLLTGDQWAEGPGLVLDFLVRQGYVSSRSFGFVQLRNTLFGEGEKLPPPPEALND
jgi:hypothetical protein